jgi:hypothetical protein
VCGLRRACWTEEPDGTDTEAGSFKHNASTPLLHGTRRESLAWRLFAYDVATGLLDDLLTAAGKPFKSRNECILQVLVDQLLAHMEELQVKLALQAAKKAHAPSMLVFVAGEDTPPIILEEF